MKYVLSFLMLSLFAGCIYDVPVYVKVDTSETAFVVELEGDSEQGTIKSEKYLADKMVATKRIQIPYRWISTGYSPMTGKYIPNTRVIVVDRAPETREWIASNNKGTSNKDQGIWVESSDSVGFSTGISITARIANEADAVKFLYNYPPKKMRTVEVDSGVKENYNVDVSDLADIMDMEIRTKIQEVFSEEAAKCDMDTLRPKKNEMVAQIREVVIPHFAERGITITAIGLFGGFTYENPANQAAIDAVFAQQQDEEVAKAECKAAEVRKMALQLVGEGEADKAVAIAQGRADAVKLAAEAEATAIQQVADAKAYELQKLSENPEAYIALKKMEIDMVRAENWDGKYPVTLLGGGGEALNMFLPTPKTSK